MTTRQSLMRILTAEMSQRERRSPGRYTKADPDELHICELVEHVAYHTNYRPDWRDYYMNTMTDRAYRRMVIAVQREVYDRIYYAGEPQS